MSMRLAKAASISLANQVVSSGTNFAVVLFLVRVLEKGEFGLYSLGFAVMLLLAGLSSSAIAVQYVVNLPDQPLELRADYALHHANATALLSSALLLFGLLLAVLPISLIEQHLRPHLIIACFLAAALYGCRDFLVRVAYSEKKEKFVLYSSLTVMLVTIPGLLAMQKWWPDMLSAGSALYVLAMAQIAGWVLLQALLKLPIKRSTRSGMWMAFQHAWKGGRWNVMTNIVYNLRTQAHNFIVAPMLGLAAVAEINAARVLVTPAVMAIPPLSQIILPRLSVQRQQGIQRLRRYTIMVIAGMAAIALGYSLLLLPWIDELIVLALGEAYQDAKLLVLGWCGVTLCLAMRNGVTLGLQSLREFKGLMWANSAGAVTAITLAYIFCVTFAQLGAVLALGLAELFLFVFLYSQFLKITNSYSQNR